MTSMTGDESGAEEPEITINDIAAACPERVISYIAEHGLEYTGEIVAKDAVVLGAFRDGMGRRRGVLTLPGEDRAFPKQEWKDLLRARQPLVRAGHAGWSARVRLQASVVSLKDAAAEGDLGLLQPLLRRWRSKACGVEVFSLPAVEAVIQHKWLAFARSYALILLWVFLACFASFICFTVCLHGEDAKTPLPRLLETPRGRLAVLSELSALLFAAPLAWAEVRSVRIYGIESYLTVWNIIDVGTYGLLPAVSALHLSRAPAAVLTQLSAVLCLLLWLKLQYFLRVFHATRVAPVDLIKGVVSGVGWLLAMIMLTMLGFAHTFFLLFRSVDSEDYAPTSSEDFTTPARSVVSSFGMAMGVFDVSTFMDTPGVAHGPATTLFLAYMLTTMVILLPLVVAAMVSVYDNAKIKEHARFLCSKALLICEIEAALPHTVKARSDASWFPPYVHVLRVAHELANPAPTDPTAAVADPGLPPKPLSLGEPLLAHQVEQLGATIARQQGDLAAEISQLRRDLQEALDAGMRGGKQAAGGGVGGTGRWSPRGGIGNGLAGAPSGGRMSFSVTGTRDKRDYILMKLGLAGGGGSSEWGGLGLYGGSAGSSVVGESGGDTPPDSDLDDNVDSNVDAEAGEPTTPASRVRPVVAFAASGEAERVVPQTAPPALAVRRPSSTDAPRAISGVSAMRTVDEDSAEGRTERSRRNSDPPGDVGGLMSPGRVARVIQQLRDRRRPFVFPRDTLYRRESAESPGKDG
ncbi:unnamed protein product [Pedinophyceae sp. YPF-701]|nr:unnamed protein product [Pedinophyceae sp. YPF-701]